MIGRMVVRRTMLSCLEGRTAPPQPLQPPRSPHPQSSNCAVASKIMVAFGPLQGDALCERGLRLKGFDQNVCVWNVFVDVQDFPPWLIL